MLWSAEGMTMSEAATTTTSAQPTILYDVTDGIATVTFNRPEARNAFTFLNACVVGEVEGITIFERINAARGVLEHTSRIPHLMDAVMEGAGMLSDEDVLTIAAELT